ncbi:hypothetical protein AD934_02465, partial [Gluconobacter oxydans]
MVAAEVAGMAVVEAVASMAAVAWVVAVSMEGAPAAWAAADSVVVPVVAGEAVMAADVLAG